MRVSTLLFVPFLMVPIACSESKPTPYGIDHVAFSPKGRWLVGAGGFINSRVGRPWGGGGMVKMWDTTTWKLVDSCQEGFTTRVAAIYFVTDDSFSVTSEKVDREAKGSPVEGTWLRTWSIAEKKEYPKVLLDDLVAARVAYHPPSKLIAMNSGGEVKVFGMPDMQQKAVLAEHKTGAGALRFSPDGTRILSRASRPTLRLHDTTMGNRVAEHALDASPARYAEFSADGKMIAVVAENKKVYVLSADLKSILLTVDTDNVLSTVTFAPDHKMIAIKKDRDNVELHSIASKKVERIFKGNLEGVNDCCFSPDGAWIAIASGGHPQGETKSPGRVRVFEVKTGKFVAELE